MDDDSPQSPLYSLFWYTVTLYYKQSTRSWVNGDTLGYSSSNKIYVAILYVTYITIMSCLGPKKANIPTKIPTYPTPVIPKKLTSLTRVFPFSPLCPHYISQLYHHFCWYVPFGASVFRQSEIPKIEVNEGFSFIFFVHIFFKIFQNVSVINFIDQQFS